MCIIEDGVDRVTELPVHLKENILHCLSIDEAVRTSILSSKWKYCWTGLRKLKFDEDFWFFVDDSKLLEHSRVIDRVLVLHHGPIREFVLLIPSYMPRPLDINFWLLVLSRNGVQRLVFHDSRYLLTDDRICIPSCSWLFHCCELETVSLCGCKLTLPAYYKGFAYLKILRLVSVEMEPNALASLISGCPLLESLSLRLTVRENPLSLKAPNLKTFSFYGYDYELGNIIFEDVPKLTCLTLQVVTVPGIMDTSVFCNNLVRLCSSSCIMELKFDFCLFEVVSENFPSTLTPLNSLNSLSLGSVDLCAPSDVLFTFCLLKIARNLKNLTIHVNSIVDSRKLKEAATKQLKSEAKKEIRYDSLQNIKISGMRAFHRESLFFKILQARCSKSVRIIFEDNHYNRCGFGGREVDDEP